MGGVMRKLIKYMFRKRIPRIEQAPEEADSTNLSFSVGWNDGKLIRIVAWRLRVHFFRFDDAEHTHHDHPWSFYTFPLRSYVEEVFVPETGEKYARLVRRFRLHYRQAELCHRLIAPYPVHDVCAYRECGGKLAVMPMRDGGQPLTVVTIVWTAHPRRKWGYWPTLNGKHRWAYWLEHTRGDHETDPPCR